MNLAWTIGESETQQLFVGLEGLVLDREDSSSTVLRFTDESCINDYCDLCHNSSTMTVFLVAFCFLVSIPPLVINYKRASRTRDHNSSKFWCVAILVVRNNYFTEKSKLTSSCCVYDAALLLSLSCASCF